MKYILSLSMLAGSALAAKGGHKLFEALGQAASNGQGKGSSNPGKGHAHGHDHDHSYVDQGRHCPSDKLAEEAEAQNPVLAARRRNLDAYTKKFEDHVKSNNGNGNNGKRGLLQTGAITIPVYYHVLVRTQSSVPNADLQAQLDVINEDYGSYNSELDSLPSHFTNNGWDDDLAGDFGISFTWDTSDINRVTTRDSFGTNDDIKRSNRGGSDHVDGYLNVWVGTLSGGVLGYASFPGETPSLDGVVIGTGTMPGGSSSPYDKGRTLTHEIGHWLNLRHIWGDGGCNADDGVSDTPPDNGANYDCPSNRFSSGCSGGDAMWMNFMDYTDDACMWMFTEGQKIRALAAIQLYRDEFLTGGCPVIPGCASYNTDSCACTACRFGSYDDGAGGCDSCQCGGCNDYPNWYDSDGPAYDCSWYSGGSRCASFGSGYANGNCYGQSCTANVACCTCGGGESAGDCISPATCSSFCGTTCGPVGPTPPTTAEPTGSPTTEKPTGSPTTRQPTTRQPTGSPTTRQPTPPPTTRQPTTQCGNKKAQCNTGADCCSGRCNTRKNWCR